MTGAFKGLHHSSAGPLQQIMKQAAIRAIRLNYLDHCWPSQLVVNHTDYYHQSIIEVVYSANLLLSETLKNHTDGTRLDNQTGHQTKR